MNGWNIGIGLEVIGEVIGELLESAKGALGALGTVKEPWRDQ